MRRGFLRQALLLLVLTLVPAIVQAVYFRKQIDWHAPMPAADEVTLETARQWGDAVLWVDARPDAQFDDEHIPGAISLNEDRWNELLPLLLAAWSPERRVIVYCNSHSCGASHEVARRLREEAQLKDVSVLFGGWEKWKEAQP